MRTLRKGSAPVLKPILGHREWGQPEPSRSVQDKVSASMGRELLIVRVGRGPRSFMVRISHLTIAFWFYFNLAASLLRMNT